MGGKLLERHLAREDDARRGWAFLRHLPQTDLVGALADYDEFGPRTGGENPGPDANERVLPFALDQSRNAHDRRLVANPVTCAQLVPPRRRKCEVFRRDAARQAHDSRVPDERAEPTEGCLRQVGDDVGVVKDLPQSQAPGRDPCPADLVSVSGRNDFAGPGGFCGLRHEAERRRCAEPNRLDGLLANDSLHLAAHAWDRKHDRSRVAYRRPRLRGVVLVRPAVRGRRAVDDEGIRVELAGEAFQIRLYSSLAGRKVVRHQERPSHAGNRIWFRPASSAPGCVRSASDCAGEVYRPLGAGYRPPGAGRLLDDIV